MEEKVFSLSSVMVTISNNDFGNTTFGYKMSLGGGGKLIGSIKYSYAKDLFTQETTADGGAVVSFNKSLAGTISIDITQTSVYIPQLVEFVNWCRNNPEKAFSQITITDTAGNIQCTANNVTPVRIPDNTISGTAGSRTFDFNAKEIIATC